MVNPMGLDKGFSCVCYSGTLYQICLVFIFALKFFIFFLNIGTESDIRIPRMNMSHYRFFSRQLELMQVGYVHDGQFIFSYLVR